MKKTTTTETNRLRDLDGAGEYLQVSRDTIERLINAGTLPVVKLPITRRGTFGQDGANRRVLIDTRDLDRLIESSKEYRR